VNFLREVAATLARYIRGEAKIIGILMVLYLVGFGALGVPLWPLWGVLAGLGHPIPFAGVIFGMLAPLLAMWIGGGDLWQILGVAAVYTIVQTIEGFVLSPRILGKSLGLSAWTVFLCALIGGALFGPLGVIFAAPIAAIAALAWRFTHGLHQQGSDSR
jgi:predicted PurR-regulated permease PerM